MCSNIFFKPIRISRSSHSATRQLRPNCAFRRSISRSPLPGERQISVSSQTSCSSSFEKKEEEEKEEAKRRADKRGQGEGSTRLDYFYTRHADLLGADLEPRSSLALRLPSSSSEYTASVIYFSILERNFILSVGEKNSVFMYFLLLFGSSPSKRLSRERFFFVRRRGEEKSASEKLYIFFSIIGSFYPPCYFVGAKNFFNTYRLLIDEVENNVEILKLISKLSDRI